MSVALSYIPHYTYDDYLHWEGRWELIGGIPYSMSETKKEIPLAMSPAPNLKHQDINTAIVQQLRNKLESCGVCKAFMFIDWKIDEDTIVQPDVSIVCGTSKSKTFVRLNGLLTGQFLLPTLSYPVLLQHDFQ